MPPPVIYINGYPGVGKLTVGRELAKLIPTSKVVDNHLFIDPVAAIFERWMPEYQPLRRQLRKDLLEALSTSPSTRSVTWIFTDQQSSNPEGAGSPQDYLRAAEQRGSRFYSIILNCSLKENIKRLKSREGLYNNTKLTDPEILVMIRQSEDIYRFGGEDEFEIDNSGMTPGETARVIFEKIGERERNGRCIRDG